MLFLTLFTWAFYTFIKYVSSIFVRNEGGVKTLLSGRVTHCKSMGVHLVAVSGVSKFVVALPGSQNKSSSP